MIKIEDILDKTNQGLDVILYYYPQATDAIGTKKPFKMRNERTASAYVKLYGNQYKVTDFGDDSHAMSIFDIVMKEESISFTESLFLLADRYQIGNTLNQNINRPDIRKRAPEDNEIEGFFNYELNKEFSPSELSVWGPNVKEEHLTKLSYFSVRWYSRTKKNDKGVLETTVISSNENYPIFLRDLGEFKKVYQPLNYDKAFRFFYVGTKPKDYVNGLDELRKAWKDYNNKERENHEDNPSNESKPYKQKKFEYAVLCSGERDAVNCFAHGYNPIWLNSETADLESSVFWEIHKMVENFVNIPDIDPTGLRKGIELGMKFLKIRTARLPDWLRNYKDIRGKSRKDLRDFIELRPKKFDFDNLLKTSMPYEFWESVADEKTGKPRVEINTAFMLNFLHDSGFCKIQDEINDKEILVQVKNNVVKKVNSKDVRSFLVEFVRKNIHDIRIHNLILNSTRTKTVTMDDLKKVEIDFKDFTQNSQFIFLKNRTLEITGNEIKEHKPGDISRFVWDSKISPHNFKRLQPCFEITQNDEFFDISVLNIQSHYFRYLINTSRIHWKTELIDLKSHDDTINAEYFEKNKFTIEGSMLSKEEVLEQKQNLVAKIFMIGYLMHGYKDMSRAWAPWIMEDTISESSQSSSGGSGKSFMTKALTLLGLKKQVEFNGRNRKLTDNQHLMDKLTMDTDFMTIEDAGRGLDFYYFYGMITGSMDINKKMVNSFNLDFEDSPKVVFNSNYPPPSSDSSTLRRLLINVVSDWYHEKTAENDYTETKTIADDFGYQIMKGNYKDEFYNEDINFIAECVKFYLSVIPKNLKIQPPMDKVRQRINISVMGDSFKEWADVYFCQGSFMLDHELPREDVYKDFTNSTGLSAKLFTPQRFMKSLKAFCANTDYIKCLNPQHLAPKGRIMKTVQGRTQEYIFIETNEKNQKQDNEEDYRAW